MDIIEKLLNDDLVNVSGYFIENELIINLKAGKSECMLLGTSKKTEERSQPSRFNLWKHQQRHKNILTQLSILIYTLHSISTKCTNKCQKN